MVLNFQEKIVAAEEICIFVGEFEAFVITIGHEGFIDIAAEAGGEGDEAFGLLLEQVFIDAGLVIKAFEVGGGHQVDQIAVAFLVFAEQYQVVVPIGIGARFVALLGDINFAADDGVDAFGVRFVIELDGTEEIAVIRHGDGGHFLFGDNLHELLDFASAIEKGIVSVTVEVNERCISHGYSGGVS